MDLKRLLLTSSYNFEIDRLVKEINHRKARRIIIQIPDGLKPHAFSLSKIIEEKTQAEVFLSSRACYGACDIDIEQAKILHTDLIVHYGHSQFVSINEPAVIFMDAKSNQDLSQLLKKALDEVAHWKKIGLATTIQHLDILKKTYKKMNIFGVEVLIAPKGGHNIYDGQIIGCDYTPLKMIADKVNAFLIIGSMFHGIGASMAINKPIVLADPYSNQIINMSELKDRIIKRRYAAITKAKEAKNFGIIISTKIGQFVPEYAARIKKKISSYGKTVTTIIADEIQPDLLCNFQEVQVFINTACPRISYDDGDRFTKPVLTPKEVLVAVGELKWEDLLSKGFL